MTAPSLSCMLIQAWTVMHIIPRNVTTALICRLDAMFTITHTFKFNHKSRLEMFLQHCILQTTPMVLWRLCMMPQHLRTWLPWGSLTSFSKARSLLGQILHTHWESELFQSTRCPHLPVMRMQSLIRLYHTCISDLSIAWVH